MPEGRGGNPAIMGLVSAAVAVWLIYDISTASEAPSRALAILQYVLLACALIGAGGLLVRAMSQK